MQLRKTGEGPIGLVGRRYCSTSKVKLAAEFEVMWAACGKKSVASRVKIAPD